MIAFLIDKESAKKRRERKHIHTGKEVVHFWLSMSEMKCIEIIVVFQQQKRKK